MTSFELVIKHPNMNSFLVDLIVWLEWRYLIQIESHVQLSNPHFDTKSFKSETVYPSFVCFGLSFLGLNIYYIVSNLLTYFHNHWFIFPSFLFHFNLIKNRIFLFLFLFHFISIHFIDVQNNQNSYHNKKKLFTFNYKVSNIV